jgi:hypothetical protein
LLQRGPYHIPACAAEGAAGSDVPDRQHSGIASGITLRNFAVQPRLGQ